MYQLFNKTLSLLNFREKLFLLIFSLLNISSIFFDFIGIALIPIFVSQILETSQPFEGLNFVNEIILKFNASEENIIFIYLILTIFILKFLILATFSFLFEKFSKMVTFKISSNLYKGYLLLPYRNFFKLSSSLLQRNIILEVNAVDRALSLFCQISKDVCMIILIIILFTLSKNNDFYFILSLLVIFTLLFYLLLKKLINRLSTSNQVIMGELLRNVGGAINGIKEVILGGKRYYFSNKYSSKHKIFQNNNFYIAFISKFPKLILELIVIVTVLLIMFILLKKDVQPEEIVVSITFLTIASIRLAPCFNSISVAVNTLNALLPSINLVFREFKFVKNNLKDKLVVKNFFGNKVENILFNKISYSYYNKEDSTIKDFSAEIKSGDFVGISGKTGSGKSTFINLMSGLLTPSNGEILTNNKSIIENEQQWHKYIGYVPQDIFLFEDTIKNNITFGLDNKEIDEKKLEKVIKLSELKDFLSALPNGINTNLGNNAINISGGQKQRIGIARALYLDREVIVLDEATNSLDVHIENKVLENIKQYYKNKIVFMITHNLNNLKKANKIILFSETKNAIITDNYDEFITLYK